jgi:hypothetical protein
VFQSSGQMGFTKADPSEQDDIGFVFEELESEEVLDGQAVDLFGPVPLEWLEGLDDRKPSESDFPLDGAVESGVHCLRQGGAQGIGWVPSGLWLPSRLKFHDGRA